MTIAFQLAALIIIALVAISFAHLLWQRSATVTVTHEHRYIAETQESKRLPMPTQYRIVEDDVLVLPGSERVRLEVKR